MNTFYITTPIYYANSLPHLGHLYTTTVSDVVHRYKKQRGFETFFLTGTDEHGINIQRAAEDNKRTPQEQVDFVAGELKKMFADFRLDEAGGGYDIFMRTTNEFHYEGVQVFWKQMAENSTPKGNSTIYKDFYKAWFCAPCAEFKTETEYEIREGEEIPRCLVHEKPLDRVEEESYFFRLSDYSEILLEKIEQNENLIRPESRRNEIISFIKGGLQDLSISREKKNVSWGIPVPGDKDHVMYVWVDALSNYLTAIGFGNKTQENIGWEKFWQNAHHFVGKDILRFHTVYWFSFLIAAGIELPKTVFAHGMWLDGDGRKMGKTLGNIIKPQVLHELFQTDGLRYFLLREMSFGRDGKFSYENLIERANADLAKGLGNLSSRTLSMITKYRDGLVPDGTIHEENFIYAKRAGVSPDEQELVSVLESTREEFIREFDDFNFGSGLEAVWKVIARIDKTITESAPWNLIKDEDQEETLNAVLYRATETLRWLCVLLHPVMPESTKNIYAQIGLDDDISKLDPAQLKWGDLKPGTKIGETAPVFPRLDQNKIMKAIEEKQEEENEAAKAAENNYISIDDFFKVELKVGEVLECESVPKSEKLLECKVDLGEEDPRQILAGMAQHYSPEDMVGKKIVVVSNLKPRKMMGMESQGMICAASVGEDDKPVLATFLEDVPNGARLK
ncbi:MAG: methionine--tRNA ligase [Pyrinomonadaceae bacterium]|nr:methionine--tRNA ligase [Pyrinomonadaceae bacterium]